MCVVQAVEGAGLAFIVYSEAIKNMPLSQLWSVLYFFMLLLLGMGSMLGNVTAIITPLRDFKIMSGISNEMFNGESLSSPFTSLNQIQKIYFVQHYCNQSGDKLSQSGLHQTAKRVKKN